MAEAPDSGAVPVFAAAAPRLLDNGYEPLPILQGTKKPAPKRWTSLTIDPAQVAAWSRRFPGCGIGLRTGALVGVDIDLLDPDLAHRVASRVQARLGETLMRVGLWPKRLLLYRTGAPFPKLSVPRFEILGAGQQFVVFGRHPDTGQPYYWPLGETPLDVPLADLPCVDAAACEDLLAEVAAFLPRPSGAATGCRRTAGPAGAGPVRDEDGRIIDGRDGWLSSIAFHAVHDAGDGIDAGTIAARVWQRFADSTDLARPKKDGGAGYGPDDAARKVADKLRLLREGRLPPRDGAPVEAAWAAPEAGLAEAREQLERALGTACAQITAWHEGLWTEACPRIGIRATVGLGKSVRARAHLLALRERLVALGAPSRILVFTPSHGLAEETAALWREAGARAAVLRGYEAKHPRTGAPMCRDTEAVRAAVDARLDVHATACKGTGERRCAFLDGCLKQVNRAEIAAADIVVAAYDALFSGFALDAASIGVMLIDEGCWARALRETRGIRVETFAQELTGVPLGTRSRVSDAADLADLQDLRGRAAAALAANGPGPLARTALQTTGLTAEDCTLAARLEERRLRDPGLHPGMSAEARTRALDRVRINARSHDFAAIWRAMADLLAGDGEGRLAIHGPGTGSGLHEIVATGVKAMHHHLRRIPLLHLDATLRPELAGAILPGLAVTEIEAAAPFMAVRLVAGSFAKGTLCVSPRATAEENRRRENRLAECVDYLRWQARRHAPGRTLVVTHKDCEGAFGGIPGVDVAHFNAIAGLDCWRDVRLLVVVGRPLPSETALHPLCGAFFRHASRGDYRHVARGVRMRDGASRSVRAIEHEDERAEILRAAICDDELIQAIGRGRGINRTEADPLEVHLLADVALPLVHDRVLAWETVAPDVVQRMLLTGLAVDSPADAAVLHPAVFTNEKQAQKAFERAGFKRQNPISNTYREMSLKSAAYRRRGRGCGWQRAWWIEGSSEAAAEALNGALGPLAEWVPNA